MLKCKICEHEFVPVIDEHYVSRDNGVSGLAAAIRSPEEKHYDTFDCPICGCQVIAQERKRQYISDFLPIKEDNDDE